MESDIVLWNSLASAANDAGRRAAPKSNETACVVMEIDPSKKGRNLQNHIPRINSDPTLDFGMIKQLVDSFGIPEKSCLARPKEFFTWKVATSPCPTACRPGSGLARRPMDQTAWYHFSSHEAKATYASVFHNTGTEVAERGYNGHESFVHRTSNAMVRS